MGVAPTSVILDAGLARTGKSSGTFAEVGANSIGKLNQQDKAAVRRAYILKRQANRRVDIGIRGTVKFNRAGGLFWRNSPGQCSPASSTFLGQRQGRAGIPGTLSKSDGRYICRAPIGFYEQSYPARENDFRIFIDGVEVTAYVRGAVTYTYETTGGTNTARFVLNNNHDSFIITPLNICSNLSPHGWRIDTQSFFARVSHSEPRYDELAKFLLYRKKYKRVSPGTKNAEIDPETGMWLYPLNPYDSIINRHDPIRIFRKLSHIDGVAVYKRTKKYKAYYDLWTSAYTGFVNNCNWEDEYVKGDRSMHIDCYDYRGLMDRMRVRITGLPLKTGNRNDKTRKDFVDDIFAYSKTKSDADKALNAKAKAAAESHNIAQKLRDLNDFLRRNGILDCKNTNAKSATTKIVMCANTATLKAKSVVTPLTVLARTQERNFILLSEKLVQLSGEKATLIVGTNDVKFFYERIKTNEANRLNSFARGVILSRANTTNGNPQTNLNTTSTTVSAGAQSQQQQAAQAATGNSLQVNNVVAKPVIDVKIKFINVDMGATLSSTVLVRPKAEASIQAKGDLNILQALATYLVAAPDQRGNEQFAQVVTKNPEVVQAPGRELTDKEATAAADFVDTQVVAQAVALIKLSKSYISPTILSGTTTNRVDRRNKQAFINKIREAVGKVTKDITLTKKKLQEAVNQLKALIKRLNEELAKAKKQQEQILKRNKLSTTQALDKFSEIIRRYNEVRRQGAQTLDQRIPTANNIAELIVNEPTFTKRHAGLFADLVRAVGKNDHPLAGMCYEEAAVWLCCANSLVLPATLMELSGYGGRGKTPLQNWNKTVIFGVAGRPLTYQEVTKAGRLSTADLDSVLTPFRPLLHMLLPKSGTGARTIVQQDITANTGNSTSFQYATRKGLLDEISELLNYQWFTNGWGDIVFEFPHYNAAPGDFGNLFQGAYTLEKEITGITVTPESSDLYTAWVITGQEPQKVAGTGGSITTKNLFYKISIIAPILARRIGVRVEHVDLAIPGVGAQIGSTKQPAGGIESLIAYGLMHVQKQLGEAYNVSIKEFPDRPYLLPNRPLWIVPRQKICLTKAITYTLNSPNGDAMVSVETGFTRWMFRDGTFRTIAGGQGPIIDYAGLFTGAIQYNIREGIGNSTRGASTDRSNPRKRQRSLSQGACDPRLRSAYIRSSSFGSGEIAKQSNQWQQLDTNTVGSDGFNGLTPPVSTFGFGRYGAQLSRKAMNPGNKNSGFTDTSGTGVRVQNSKSEKNPAYQINSLFHNPYPFGQGWNKGNPHYNSWGSLRYSAKGGSGGYHTFNVKRSNIEVSWHSGTDLNVPAGKDILAPINLDNLSTTIHIGPGPGKTGNNQVGWAPYAIAAILPPPPGVTPPPLAWTITKEGKDAIKFSTSEKNPQYLNKVIGSIATRYVKVYSRLYKIWKKSKEKGRKPYKIKRDKGLGGVAISGYGQVGLPNATTANGFEGKNLRCHLRFVHNQEVMGEDKGNEFVYYGRGIKTVTKGTVIAKVGAVGTSSAHLHLEMYIVPPSRSSKSDDAAYKEALKANNEYLTTQLLIRFSGGNPSTNELSPFWKKHWKTKRLGITTVREAVELVLRRNKKFKYLIDPAADASRVYTNPMFFFKPEELTPYAKKWRQEERYPTYYSSKGLFVNIGKKAIAGPPICNGADEADVKRVQTKFTKCLLSARQRATTSYRQTSRAIYKCRKDAFKENKKIAAKVRKQRRKDQQVAAKVKSKARKSMRKRPSQASGRT